MSAFRTAFVYVRNVFAGELSETDDGYTFAYDSDYLKTDGASPVSLTLPLSDEEYTSKTLFSFFDGLIPEGWLLDVVTRNWKIDRRDRFGLLLVSCKQQYQIQQTASVKLSWSHYCELLSISDENKRSFYEKEAINTAAKC
ncbi:MAG: HipA N-terminal domain-containing protein [Oscillospiraceae bacterium]